jgi:hypothetical protein
MKTAIILMSIVLTACSATVPATMRIERNHILRGSASGKVGRDAVISVNNIEGLSCGGMMFVPVTETITEGTIQCRDLIPPIEKLWHSAIDSLLEFPQNLLSYLSLLVLKSCRRLAQILGSTRRSYHG